MVIPAVLAAVVVGLAALLVMFAYVQLMSPVFNRLGALPVIGGAIGAVSQFLMNAFADAYAWADQGVMILTNVISYPINYVVNTFQGVANGFIATYNQINWIRNGLIPQQVSQVVGLVWDLFNTTESQISGALATAEVYALTVAMQVQGVAFSLFDTSQNQIAAALATAEVFALQAAENVQGVAFDLFTTAESQIAAGVQQAEVFGLQAAQQAASLAETLFNQAEADARTYTDAGVSQLEQQVAGAQAQLQLQVAAEVATLGGALALVQTAVQTIEESPCIQECATLGNLGQEIDQLADLAFVAALIGWVGTSTKDPQAAAGEVTAVFGDLAQGAAQLVETVAGVQ